MLGLVVNPVAGVGGPAGLAGSDGGAVQREAFARGATPRATSRAVAALEVVVRATTGTAAGAAGLTAGVPRAATGTTAGHAAMQEEPAQPVVLTAAGALGADAVRGAGLIPRVVYTPSATNAVATSPADTMAAVKTLVTAGATLILFAGGDGTARDVAAGLAAASAATSNTPAALGIPAGVKMYSPVFAVSPQAAGAVAAAWLSGPLPVQQREVLDVDEAAMRRARVEPRLYGMMPVPYRPGRTQARKAPTAASEHEAAAAAARAVARMLRPGVRYLLGPGSTMAEVARTLGVQKTPLGVDVVLDGEVVCREASEADLMAEITRGPAQAVVTVIGGQGFLLGRGNQQLSARVVRALGADPLIVVAPEQKLIDLQGRPLLVDTGDPALDETLAGFIRVVTGPGAMSMYPVTAPTTQNTAQNPTPTPIEGERHVRTS